MAGFGKISIVIPVYNERNTVRQLIDRVVHVQIPVLDKEIIVVDDASTDGTWDIVCDLSKEHGLKILHHEVNLGKGAALRTGFEAVTGDIVIIQDADLEYDPSEYPILIEPILKGKADVVFGSRFHAGPRRVLFFWHYLGNKFLTLMSNAFNDLNLSDMETCYKVFKADILKKIKLKSNRFGFEPEFTAKIAKNRYKVYEVPVRYDGRDYSEGKKITWRDGIKAIFAIAWFRFFD